MGKWKTLVEEYVGKVRKFLEEFYNLSERPNCMKMTENDFRETVKSLKKPPEGK